MSNPLTDRGALRDKILGCWVGKNCGGTLGGPIEKAYSQEEPFHVSYYTVIQEGGIPNDDLEIQLAWLKALEEVGLDLTAPDLASYWLDHVGYNPDEYGLMKANLRLGIRPPMSGFYNNFFKHSMGCPIRTEIWACIAPGNPRLAARYAFEDSICDHAGGESINGSLFNVTVEASAFVVRDPKQLIEVGLSYIPEESVTARCIRAAVQAHRNGEDWLGARRRVLEIGANINAQYSPPNIAFQVVGWLYGKDFGDSLCKAVNCGYDTDCTAATLGAILGILDGEAGIPGEWKAPLGENIATSDSTGGVKHFYKEPNPVPASIGELTERVLRLQELAEAKFGKASADMQALKADGETKKMALASPTQVSFRLSPQTVLAAEYGGSPQIEAGRAKKVILEISHEGPEPVAAELSVLAPEGWECDPSKAEGVLSREKKWRQEVLVKAPARALLENSNEVLFNLRPVARPGFGARPLALIGAPVYLRTEIFAAPAESEPGGFLIDCVFAPEKFDGDLLGENARGGGWRGVCAEGNDVGQLLKDLGKGVSYLRGFVKSAGPRTLWMHLCSTIPAKAWINGVPTFRSTRGRIFRPWSLGYTDNGELEGEVTLKKGWNEILLKFAADERTAPFQCHLLYSDPKNMYAGVTDLLWTRFPWDE